MADSYLDSRYEDRIKKGEKRNLKARVFHTCTDLVPANLLMDHLDLTQVKDLGLREVPLDQIVGSLGRANDFDLHFDPRRPSREGRWQRVAKARIEGKTLPQPVLYKIGKRYYVVDGNHRISVARSLGETSILADVREIEADSLKEDLSCTRTGLQIRESRGCSS